MAFRFFKRLKVAPGVTFNLSKRGGSLSFGPPGAKLTAGTSGLRRTVGIPGTGFYYTSRSSLSSGRGRARSQSPPAQPAPQPKDQVDLGFFTRLFTSASEQAWADGLKTMLEGDEQKAYGTLAGHTPMEADSAFVAGILALKLGHIEASIQHLREAYEKRGELGKLFQKYGLAPQFDIQITDDVRALIGADVRGVLLALVEAFQIMNRPKDAMSCLEHLLRLDEDDVVVKVSMAELLLEHAHGNKNVLDRVVRLSQGVENESEVHGTLLLFRAQALRQMGLLQGARDTLTPLLRRKKNRPDSLLHAIRYERALVYEESGKKKQARKDLERIYAQDPDFEDVAERLGLTSSGTREGSTQ